MGHSASKNGYSDSNQATNTNSPRNFDDEKTIHTFPRNVPVAVKPNPKALKNKQSFNVHEVQPDIKIHAIASQAYIDPGDDNALNIPLGEVTDEQLLAEIARRKIDIHHSVTESLVRETYVFERNIGHGASGEVFLVSNRFTNDRFACKVVRKDTTINDAKSMSTEIEIMKRIRHRNIVAMYELYESPKCLWIVLEFINGGDLRDHLTTATLYTEVMAARYVKQILLAIHYLHSLGIVHRDLKLDNILRQIVNDVSIMKVADFGLSALCRIGDAGYDAEDSGKRKGYKGLKEMWGTKEFFAPELIDQAYGPQADMWSIGCIMYEMLTGRLAFPYRDRSAELYMRIQSGAYDQKMPALLRISPEGRDLLKCMLTVDPIRRYSATEALEHPWITGQCHTEDHNKHLEITVENFRIVAAHRHHRR
eukprot:CAMPEP_0182419260 /NCGR_PEP_ID=MMETSP1167-20130531/3673_1 /TAXON_ID=2988 /ORGANISM="Mallomonas Sp, Strain CCMP3275" /LENGTH=421 /DNA_ID=CAMNT_0024594037 /DNA_START=145 /DNA_END=1410 /DNA_ORIENTATION=+